MKITRDNYEAYLLDMIEGRLSADRKEDLLKFLGENRDIATDFEFDNIAIPDCTIDFPLKDDLKKGDFGQDISRANYGQFCIARLEGELSAERVRELEAFLENNPDCAREALIYDRLRLSPDNSIVFPLKNTIRKRHHIIALSGLRPVKRLIFLAGSVAATIAVLISVWLFIPGTHDAVTVPVASSGNAVNQPGESVLQSSPGGNEMQAGLPLDHNEISSDGLNKLTTAVYSPLPEVMVDENRTGLAREYRAASRELPLLRAERTDIRNLRVSTYATGGLDDLKSNAGAPVFSAGINRLQTGFDYENEPVSRSPVAGLVASLSNLQERSEEREKFTLRHLAQAGLKGLNSLGGTSLLYERETDASGERVKVVFSAGPVEFRRSATITGE